MTILELNHVAVAVADVERSLRFYRDAIGLPVVPRPDFDFPGAWFRLGRHQELHLLGGRQDPAGDGTPRRGHFALLVSDIQAMAGRLRAAGVAFQGPGRRPDGAAQIFVADPDGNVVELCANLPPAAT